MLTPVALLGGLLLDRAAALAHLANDREMPGDFYENNDDADAFLFA
jgi:hypothetical protein